MNAGTAFDISAPMPWYRRPEYIAGGIASVVAITAMALAIAFYVQRTSCARELAAERSRSQRMFSDNRKLVTALQRASQGQGEESRNSSRASDGNAGKEPVPASEGVVTDTQKLRDAGEDGLHDSQGTSLDEAWAGSADVGGGDVTVPTGARMSRRGTVAGTDERYTGDGTHEDTQLKRMLQTKPRTGRMNAKQSFQTL